MKYLLSIMKQTKSFINFGTLYMIMIAALMLMKALTII